MSQENPKVFDLKSRPEKRNEVFALIERNFPKGAETSRPVTLEDEFFFLLQAENQERILFLCDENDLPTSALAWKILTLCEGQVKKNITVAAIGLVVTEEKHRGQGLSSTLLEEAESRARDANAVLCYLWSGLEFYQKRDYLPLGSELSWVLDQKEIALLDRRLSNEAPPSTLKIEDAKPSDLPGCLAIYNDMALGPIRQVKDYASFLSLPDTKMLLVKDSKGSLLGYGLIGKARDLRNTLHECVGRSEIIPQLLQELVKPLADDSQAMARIQYPQDGPLATEMKYWLGEKGPEAFALVKLLNPPLFVKFLTTQKLLHNLSIEFLEEGFQILGATGKEEFYSPDLSHLTQLFMSPFHPREFGTLSAKLSDALGDFVPVNPYFWGLDSV